MSSRRGRPSRPHIRAIQGPTATMTCSTFTSPSLVFTRVTAPESSSSKPVTSTPSAISAPATSAFLARPSIDSLLNAKPPRCSCRQTDRPGARQSGNIARMCFADLLLAQDQLGLVADPLLALGHGGEVGLLVAVAERDVAGAVVVERLGVGLPDLDAGRHQLGHRRLEVVVADDAAGDPGRARGTRGLVDHQHLLAALGEVPGGGEAVNARSDDQVWDGALARHQWSGGSQPSSTDGFQSAPTVLESSTHGPSSGCGNLQCCSFSRMP